MPCHICDHSDVGHVANLLGIDMEAAKNLKENDFFPRISLASIWRLQKNLDGINAVR